MYQLGIEKSQMVNNGRLLKTLKIGLFPQFCIIQADVQTNLNFSAHPEGRGSQESH